MDRQGRIEKKNKILGTERCETIDTLKLIKLINKVHHNSRVVHSLGQARILLLNY